MNPTLNINDLHSLLFNNNKMEASVVKKHQEFDFLQAWEEIDASAIALNDNHNQTSSNIEQSELSAFIGDVIPAAAAVAEANVFESPMMNTPFLDSCAGTPFTAASFTPSLAQFNNSPYYSPYISINNTYDMSTAFDSKLDDIQVDKYLQNEFSWQDTDGFTSSSVLNTPAMSTAHMFMDMNQFNVDPSALLLNNNHVEVATPSVSNVQTTDDSSDFLFPPLGADNDETTAPEPTTTTKTELFNPAEDIFNDCFDIPQEYDQPTSTQNDTLLPLSKNDNKRKSEHTPSVKSNKRARTSVAVTTVAIINEHGVEERKFQCDECLTLFNRRYNLSTHIKTHNKNRTKDFSCLLCQKPFDRKHDLTRHVATVHNGERAHSCNTCSSTFSRKDALVRHTLQRHNIQ